MKLLRGAPCGFVLTALLLTGPARACPLCKSGTGQQVRAGLFNGHFGANLVLTLLPIPIFLGIVALIYFGPPQRSWLAHLRARSRWRAAQNRD